MKILKFKLISLISLVGITSVVATSFFMFTSSLRNLVEKTENLNSSQVINDSSSSNLATNYSNNSLNFKDDSYSQTNTPTGYLQVNGNYIYLVSWFGNQLWKYDVSNSNFLKQNNSSITINKINVVYLANYDRVLVYGLMNTSTSFVFQINCNDGSEFYVNKNSSSKYKDSCLISSSSNQIINSVNLINLISPSIAIMIPQKLDSNHKLTCTTFSLENFSFTPITYDASGGWTTGNALNNNTTDEVVGITSYDDKTYISLKGFSNSSGNNNNNNSSKSIKIIVIKLVKNSYSNSKIWTVYEDSSNTSVDLTKANFRFVTIFKNNVPRSYVSMVKNDDDSSSLSPTVNNIFSELVYIDPTNSSEDIKVYNFTGNYSYYINEIYVDSINNKVYLLLRDKDKKSYYLLDTSKTSITFTKDDFFTVDGLNDNNNGSLHLRIIFEKNSSSSNISGIASVYNSLNACNVRKFDLSASGTKYTFTLSNWNATEVNDFSNLPKDYSKYLAQDMTLDFLKNYIYLKNVEQTTNEKEVQNNANNLYGSTLTMEGSNSLTYDNNSGTVKGSVILNLRKWWSSTTTTEKIIVPVNLSGFASSKDLAFNLIKSSDDDSTKWNQILNLQKNNFPSAISSEQILTSFINQGSKVGITKDDIAIANQTTSNSENTSDKAITVYTDDNDGTLRIVYDLSSKNISPSISNTKGDYTYYNFKSKNSYAKITVNHSALQSLKKSKAIFQVNINDLISCLNLSLGYYTDPSYWIWTPDVTITSNKKDYIDNCIGGVLSGTIAYNYSKDPNASAVSNQNWSVKIDGENSKGFITLTSLLGTNNATSVYYNDAQASKIASSYNYNKVVSEFDNILKSSVLFFNNWTTSDSLTYKITSKENNKISFTLDFKDNVKTSLKDKDNNNLVFDKDWISEIKAKSNVLTFSKTFSFEYDLTHISLSYGLSSDKNSISINDLVSDISGGQELIKEYSGLLPFQFVKKFYNSSNGTYDNFENQFKIISIPSNTEAINYYTIDSVQMVANDNEGVVTVFYTISFPNSGSVVGSSTTSTIVITGFRSTESVSKMWTIICASIASVVGFATICLLIYFLISKYKYSKLRDDYGNGSTDKELNLEVSNYRRQIFVNNLNVTRKRNTINKNTLAHRSQKKINKGIREYNKIQKEIKRRK